MPCMNVARCYNTWTQHRRMKLCLRPLACLRQPAVEGWGCMVDRP